MKHPHILEFKGAFLTSRHLALIMEYVEGETLDVSLCMAVWHACMPVRRTHDDGHGTSEYAPSLRSAWVNTQNLLSCTHRAFWRNVEAAWWRPWPALSSNSSF